MSENPSTTIAEHFVDLEDPRMDRTKKHPLIYIVVVALCAAIGGADTWAGIELFGKSERGWFAEFLDLANGVPSHDTFGRVFAALDTEQFQSFFIDWVQAICDILKGQVVAFDGKTLDIWP